MHKVGGLTLMLVLVMSAIAQTDNDSSMKKSDKMGKQKSMTGCIAEKDGKYILTDKGHPNGVQLMSSDDLKPHVGHKVKVTGMMEKMDGLGSDSVKSDEKMSKDDSVKHDDMGMMEMKVSSMKMVSEQCDMSKMMNK